ncbi:MULTISPECIES: DUF7312 domain-containing protein [Saliphagus]|uniref:DUF7312 domain-containing protein n=1 Tax=Saliphagus infecundisoli TaxID=1849069 RepID=A0ABD5QD50_9EURY|nr:MULTISPECIES: hypothetical protein [Saliphagus]
MSEDPAGEQSGGGEDGEFAATSDAGPEESDEDEEWEFSLADIEERAAGNDDDRGDGEGGPRAPEPNSASVVRGSPSAENAAFVLLGALVMVGVLVRLVAAGFGI